MHYIYAIFQAKNTNIHNYTSVLNVMHSRYDVDDEAENEARKH